MNAPPTVVVTQRFRVAPERVFDAWLDVKCIAKFAFGPEVRKETIVRLGIDAHVGGAFSLVVRRDGQELDHNGEYLVLERPHHLAFTWRVGTEDAPSRVDIKVDRTSGGCTMTLTHTMDPKWADWAPKVQHGWVTLARNLERVLGRDNFEKRPRF